MANFIPFSKNKFYLRLDIKALQHFNPILWDEKTGFLQNEALKIEHCSLIALKLNIF